MSVNSQPHFKLYLKPGCPWCTMAQVWLDQRGYRYMELDVIADAEAYTEMRQLTGQSLAPSLVVNHGQEDQLVLPDFGPDELEAFLDLYGIAPAVPVTK